MEATWGILFNKERTPGKLHLWNQVTRKNTWKLGMFLCCDKNILPLKPLRYKHVKT